MSELTPDDPSKHKFTGYDFELPGNTKEGGYDQATDPHAERIAESSTVGAAYIELANLRVLGQHDGDAMYLHVPTGDPKLGTVQLDTYYNAFHADPHKAAEHPILAVQRRVEGTGTIMNANPTEAEAAAPPPYNYLMFRAGDLNTASFATSVMAAAVDPVREADPNRVIVIKPSDTTPEGEPDPYGNYELVEDPDADPIFQAARQALVEYGAKAEALDEP